MATSKPYVSPSFSYETLEETLDIKPKGTELFIGIPKETSFNENRIALTPEAVGVMVANGHRVVVETKAGEGAPWTSRIHCRRRNSSGTRAAPSVVASITTGTRKG